MKRTPEPELMDEPSQAEAYAAADFAATDDAFVATFLKRFGAIVDGAIVDLGCGPGNIALRLAEALPDREVVGIDGSAAMLGLAREQARGLPSVRFIQSLLPSDALPVRHFGAVVSNSLLHHLHDPAGLWQTVLAIALPAAPVLIGDLRRPPTPSAAQALVETYAADAPEVLRRDFLASLHAAFEPAEIAAQLAAAGLTDWVVEPVGDRHVLVSGLVPA